MIKEIYGKKIGMTQLFGEQGQVWAVTLIEIEPVILLEKVEYPTAAKFKIGCFKIKKKSAAGLNRPQAGYFDKLGVQPYKIIREVTPATESGPPVLEKKEEAAEASVPESTPVSREVGVGIFKEGDRVDVRARTKGRGFSGGMKRWGWSGQPKTHGSTTHRRIGSAGASAYPSRIIKGIHMPGHLGDKFRTIKNLKVLRVETDKGLLFVQGGVPGSRGTSVCVKKVG